MEQAGLLHLGDRQQQLVRLLLRHKQGMRVDELARELEISRTAVHQHLGALARDGYVRRSALSPTGGRPSHVHELTEKGIHLFPKQYSWFSELLLQKVLDQLGPGGLIDWLRGLGREIGASLRGRIQSRSGRGQVEELARVMRELGYEAKVVERIDSDLPVIDAYNCVYHDLARSHEEVCELDLALMEEALGRPVEQQECMLRGGSCCRFRIKP